MSASLSNQFSIDLFNHPPQLDRFMSGEDQLNSILKISNDPNALKRPTKDSLYFGRWSVAWIYVKSPFEWILGCFTKAIALLTGFVGATRLSHYFTLLTDHLGRDSEQLSDQWRYNENLLVPSINNPQLGAWDIYRYGNIPIDKIKNENLLNYTFFRDYCDTVVNTLLKKVGVDVDPPEIKEAFFKLMLAEKTEEAIQLLLKEYPHPDGEEVVRTEIKALFNEKTLPLLNQVEFFRPRKLCKGSTLWFIHLFMKSRGYFDNVEHHAMAVAEQLRKGVPSQGILLQALSDVTNLLHRNTTRLEGHTVATDCSRSDALQKVETLPPGLYKVNVYNHAFAYIKTEEEKGYIFNPNFGLLHLNSEEMLDMVYAYHYNKDNSSEALSFDQYHSFAVAQEEAV